MYYIYTYTRTHVAWLYRHPIFLSWLKFVKTLVAVLPKSAQFFFQGEDGDWDSRVVGTPYLVPPLGDVWGPQ